MLNVLLQISKDDTSYINLLKPMINNAIMKVSVNNTTPVTLTEVVMRAREKKATAVMVTCPALLTLLVGKSRQQSLDDYAGSIIERHNIEFLILPPLKHIITVPYGKFLYVRYISKLTSPGKWLKIPEFTWELFHPNNTDSLIDTFASATFMSCDIETGKATDRIITCVGFTAVTIVNNSFSVRTVVVPFNDMYNIYFIRSLLSLAVMKVFQNGKYDNIYLLRFACPTVNWGGDTINLFHSWYSEMPKDLAFISTFTLRKWQFWKDESNTNDEMEYFAYNAKDCFATAMSWLSMVREVPDWVWVNYYQEFPLVFPCLQAELTGLKRDNIAMNLEEVKFNKSMDERLARLRKLVSNPFYNPSSPPQTVKLFAILGSGDVTQTGDKERDKVMDRHPINRRILMEIKNYREDRKLVSSYLKDGYPPTNVAMRDQTKSWHGRIFFALNPHGTDTARLASKSSAFWCGWQIQNIPRDREDVQVKAGIIADDDFFFGEVDYEQNEARGTAYLSGDTNLINTVDDISKDFHANNASEFFGIPYSEIVKSTPTLDAEGKVISYIHKVLNKPVRQLSKNTNHGANYNMGAGVMLITMGIANVRKAAQLLNLPKQWTLERVCGYLLERYELRFPVVKGQWYEKVIQDVLTTNMLVGPTGWTRYCFSDPSKSKHALNAYVAHPPQSLGAMQLNKAYMKVFFNVALKYPEDFKLGPQIHDSILFQYRKGRKDIALAVKSEMKVSIPVKDTFGITRTLTVPTSLKGEATSWSEITDITD